MSKVHVYYFLGPCSIFFSSEKQKSNFLCEYTCSCIIQIEWFVYNKKDRLLQKLFTRNSVKNILSIIVNFVRDIFARFPRAWSSRISLNANSFQLIVSALEIIFKKSWSKISLSKVCKSRNKVGANKNTCMHGYHAMNYRKWMHLILHNFKVSLSFCKVSEEFVSNCFGCRVRKKPQRNGLKMNKKIFFNDTNEIHRFECFTCQ